MRHMLVAVAGLLAVVFAAPLAAQEKAAEGPGPVVNPLTDTTTYPIAVWGMPSSTAPAFADMGVNVFVGDQGDSRKWCDEIARSRCVGFVHWRGGSPEHQAAIAASPGFLGWMHGDEPDNPGTVDGEYRPTKTAPKVLIDRYKEMKKSATPAPMYLNLGQGLAVGSWQSTPDKVYREFMKCADVVCYDVYPTSTKANGTSRLHLVARGISRLKEFAGADKPAWIWLECTSIGGSRSATGNRPPLPHELRAQVWMSILHGADGIGYFPHQFNPYKGGPAAIPPELQKEMKLTNGLLHKLAPVLRTSRRQMLEVDAGSGRVDAATWEADAGLLVVAVNMRNEPAKATLKLLSDAKEFTVVGQNRKAKPKAKAITEEFLPYEVRLYYTGPQLTTQSYRYPTPASAEVLLPENVRIDFEGDLPQGTAIKGAAVVEANAHGGKKALSLAEAGDVTLPLTDEDFRGKVTMWVYDSSKKHSKDDPNSPGAGPCWGLQDSRGRMMLFGVIRRSFLSQQSYSYAFTNRLRGYPSPGYAAVDRTKPGWYKWEFDLTQPGTITVLAGGKPAHSIGDNYKNFDQGFNAIRIVGGAKGEFEEILIDDILVEYPRPRQERPGKLADLPFQRDNRKGVLWSRTHNTRLCVATLAEAPKIDGDLTDAAWVPAETLATWSNAAGTDVASYQTVGVVGRHAGKLYMAFRCTEDFLGDLVTDKKAGWQNDCIEIWFDPSNTRTSFAHLVVTAGGKVDASRTVPDTWGEGRRDEDWKPDIKAKAGRVENGWTIEVAINLEDLGDIEANPVWAFDVARERKPAPVENSVYTTGGFNAGFQFGEMTFEPARVTLANAALVNRTDEEVTAKVEILVSEREFGDTFPDEESMWFDVARETVTLTLKPREELKILSHDLKLKMPPGGRLRFTLLEPAPVLMEEFIGNAWGGIEKK